MANGISQVGFQSPGYDYSADLAQIQRQQALAQALQQQAGENQGTQVINGWAVPQSPLGPLVKALQGGASGYMQNRSEQKQRDLAAKAQSDYSSMLAKGLSQLQGTPAKTIQPDPQENEQSADQGTPQMGPVNVPAQPPNPAAALATFGSHPMGAALMPIAMQELQRQRLMETIKQMGGAQQTPATPANPMVPGAGSSVMAGPTQDQGQSPAPQAVPQAAQGQPQAAPMLPQGQPQSAPNGVGGPAGGIPMQAWLTTDPSGKSYFEQLAKDHAPISTRYGIFGADPNKPGFFRPVGGALPQGALPYQFDSQGNVDTKPYPGQTAGITAITGAQEAGKAPFETVPITNASGATVPTFKSQLPNYPGAPSQVQPSQPMPQRTPQPAVLQNGSTGGVDPFSTIPKRFVPQGIGQTTFDRSMAEHQATTANELSKKYGELADHANQRMVLNNQALSLVDKSDTGPGAATIADVKNVLTSRFGIPESSFDNTPSSTIALQKDLLNAATQKAKAQFGTRMTQNEVMLMLSRGAPNVDMTKAAIKYLINSDNAAAQYQIKQANDLGTYLQRGGDPLRFDSWYPTAFPMTNTVGQVHMGSSVPSSPQAGKVVDWSALGR